MNILIFGPNGSGKGTQGALIQQKYGIPLIETGVIFRDQIARGTPLGALAKAYIDRGELVPDEVTIPMILSRLREDDCRNGWVLDGFPRNPAQAAAVWDALAKEKMPLDMVIEIVLDRTIAKQRIMGRRLCPMDNNHPNNVAIEGMHPVVLGGEDFCRVCGSGGLITRADDLDEAAIDRRHAIYYNREDGTLGAVRFLKEKIPVVEVDGLPGVKEVSTAIMGQIH
jgi:adenylate kinase